MVVTYSLPLRQTNAVYYIYMEKIWVFSTGPEAGTITAPGLKASAVSNEADSRTKAIKVSSQPFSEWHHIPRSA